MTDYNILQEAADIVYQVATGTQKFRMSEIKVPSIHFSTYDFSKCSRIVFDFQNKFYHSDFILDLIEWSRDFTPNMPQKMRENLGEKITFKNLRPEMVALIYAAYDKLDSQNVSEVQKDTEQGTEC